MRDLATVDAEIAALHRERVGIIRAAWLSPAPRKLVAHNVGMSLSGLVKFARVNGFPPRKGKWSRDNERLKGIEAAWRAGTKASAIAADFNTSTWRIYTLSHEHRWPRRLTKRYRGIEAGK